MTKPATAIIFIILLSSCKSEPKQNSVNQDNKAETNNHENPNREHKEKEIKPTIDCLDTTLLKNQNISFHKSVFTKNKKANWIFKISKAINDKQIESATYYYSTTYEEKCDNPIDHFELDSLQISIASKTHFIEVEKYAASSNLKYLHEGNCKFLDINFDGFLDLEINLNEVSGAATALSRYHVFNPQKKNFEEGVDLANMRLDEKRKLIYSSWNGGHAGNISIRMWQDFVGHDSLRLVRQTNSDYNDSLEAYIKKETILMSDQGDYSISIDTIPREIQQ